MKKIYQIDGSVIKKYDDSISCVSTFPAKKKSYFCNTDQVDILNSVKSTPFFKTKKEAHVAFGACVFLFSVLLAAILIFG